MANANYATESSNELDPHDAGPGAVAALRYARRSSPGATYPDVEHDGEGAVYVAERAAHGADVEIENDQDVAVTVALERVRRLTADGRAHRATNPGLGEIEVPEGESKTFGVGHGYWRVRVLEGEPTDGELAVSYGWPEP